jgi:ABC-2 type transport system permease protein
MKTILFLLQKEFIQIFRNKMMLPIIFVVPMVQLLILSFTATFEIKNSTVAFVDMDQSQEASSLIQSFDANPFFQVQGRAFEEDHWDGAMQQGKVELILRIPPGFEDQLKEGHSVEMEIITDAVNGSAANIITAYAMQIIQDYNQNIISKRLGINISEQGIQIKPRYWFNPELDYKTYMVPGILVLLVSLIGAFLSGMNVVREKEIGTIEQLNVTPIKKYQFIIGKLFPFWIIAMFDLCFGLVLAYFVFHVPILGSVFLIIGVAAIYLLLVLGLGLFISTIADTQQQAMFMAWFFFLIFIMLGGLFTPAEAMPLWAQRLNFINPIYYFIDFMRLVMLKGAGFWDVWNQITHISVYAILMLSLSIYRYRKRA